MMSLNVVLLFAFIALYTVQQGVALDCYQCNSYLKQDCWNLPEETASAYLKPCKANATACQKQSQELYYNDDYQERIYRGCMYVDAKTSCIQRTGTYRVKIKYCYCDTDGCNGAFRMQTSSLLAMIITSVLVYLFSRQH